MKNFNLKYSYGEWRIGARPHSFFFAKFSDDSVFIPIQIVQYFMFQNQKQLTFN
jgi:hypothetical protein